MRGKKTPEHLIDEVRQLRKEYPAAEVVNRMAGRGLPRRTTYRVLAQFKREDEERRRELAEQTRLALELERAEKSRRARMRGARLFRSVGQWPPRARARAG